MRKVISTILKVITVLFAIFGAGVAFQIAHHMITFSEEHGDEYGSSEEEQRRLYNDAVDYYFEDLANNARNL